MRLAPSEPAPIVRAAEVAEGAVFWFWGRPLKVVRVTGSDAAAPVILEELVGGEHWLPGQLALWSHDSVLRALASGPGEDGPLVQRLAALAERERVRFQAKS